MGPLCPPDLPLPCRFWFRLYWFPLKVLYATCHTSLISVPDIPFYFFFNALLLLLTVMNVYWFLVSAGPRPRPGGQATRAPSAESHSVSSDVLGLRQQRVPGAMRG